MVQGQPHLARSGRSLARFGRTTAGRSWPESVAARPEPAAAGHTWPGLGPAAPLGAPAPTKCHVSAPRHQQSHEQVLVGRETLILCRLDQKATIGSTCIDGPTLNRHNHHQGVILDVPQHYRCITR
jgi:hypothetical protein